MAKPAKAELRARKQHLAMLMDLGGWIETRNDYGNGDRLDRTADGIRARIAAEREAITRLELGVVGAPKEAES